MDIKVNKSWHNFLNFIHRLINERHTEKTLKSVYRIPYFRAVQSGCRSASTSRRNYLTSLEIFSAPEADDLFLIMKTISRLRLFHILTTTKEPFWLNAARPLLVLTFLSARWFTNSWTFFHFSCRYGADIAIANFTQYLTEPSHISVYVVIIRLYCCWCKSKRISFFVCRSAI